MEKLRTIAQMLDLGIDLSLKLVGIYMFFVQRDFLLGAVLLGASGMYSMSMAMAIIFRKVVMS